MVCLVEEDATMKMSKDEKPNLIGLLGHSIVQKKLRP